MDIISINWTFESRRDDSAPSDEFATSIDAPPLQRSVDLLGERYGGGFSIRIGNDVREFDWWMDFSTIAEFVPDALASMSRSGASYRLEFYEQGRELVYQFDSRVDDTEIQILSLMTEVRLAGPYLVCRESAFKELKGFAVGVAEQLVELSPDESSKRATLEYLATIQRCSIEL